MQAEPIADGQQPMTSSDVVCKVLCVHQGKAPPREAATTFFLKNAGFQTSSTRAETSAEMTLWEQLAGEQESTTTLVKLVDELKRKIEESEREFEEFKKQRQEEYNRLCEQVMRLSSPGN